MKRRHFIRNSFVAGTTIMIPGFLQAIHNTPYPINYNKLIVIQLAGGNDGLNTFIPFRNDDYYKHRPSIAIPKNQLIQTETDMAFHPSLKHTNDLYKQGELCIINQVGYPNQNKSHFRATDIWLTASDANQYLQYGWLGRYLDAECNITHAAIQYGIQKSLALKGIKGLGMAITDPAQLYKTSNENFIRGLSQNTKTKNGEVAYLYKTLTRTQQSTDYLYNTTKNYTSLVQYPKTQFSQSLKTIGSLIGAGIDTSIYYTELGGFDTHTNQLNRQKLLLKQLDDGLAALKKDLTTTNNWQNTLILIFSEFGRRITENGSKGTDHGKANNVWLAGGRLKKAGFYNNCTNLNLREENDLKHTIDFRSIYSAILQNWLKTDYQHIIEQQHTPLDII